MTVTVAGPFTAALASVLTVVTVSASTVHDLPAEVPGDTAVLAGVKVKLS